MLRYSRKLGIVTLVVSGVASLSLLSVSFRSMAQEQGDPPPVCEGNPPNGQVKCNYGAGSRAGDNYEGGFQNGKPEGQGVYVYASGDRYEGQFRNGLPNGQGVYIFADDSRIVGVFKDGNITQGTVIFPDGNRYVGEFKIVTDLGSGASSSQPHGSGEFIYANGDRFRGEFFAGQPFGDGVFTRENGARCQGEFYNQNLDGKGSCSFPDGSRYEGEFRGGVPHGPGTLIDASGKRFPGTFRAGQLVDS